MTDAEFKSLINQRVCELADVLILQYNPCGFHDGRCRLGRPDCCDSRHFLHLNNHGACPFLSESGCTVKRAKCKLWFCETVLRQADPQCIAAMRELESFARLFDLISRPLLGQRYVGRTAEIERLEGKGVSDG